MSRKREDFVWVRLSEHGEQVAGGRPLILVAGRTGQFEFTAGEPKEVTRAYDWNVVLKHERIDGKELFELVPDDEIPAESKEAEADPQQQQ